MFSNLFGKTFNGVNVGPNAPNTPAELEQGKLMEQYDIAIRLRKGEVKKGVVVEARDDGWLIDIGYTCEGFLPEKEWTHRALVENIDKPRVNDELEVQVISIRESEENQLLLSRWRHEFDRRWAQFEEKLEQSKTIHVKGLRMVNGGIIVDCCGLEGFIPTSHFPEMGKGGRLSDFINKIFEVKPLERDRRKHRLVFSRKDIPTPVKGGTNVVDNEAGNSGTIDNSGVTLGVNPDLPWPISIQLNDRSAQRLAASENFLCKNYPKIAQMGSDNRLGELLAGVFPDGMQKKVYLRNLSVDGDKGEIKVLGLRPEIIDTELDFLGSRLPVGHSLLFKGRIVGGRVFAVDGIYEAADTDRLDYEVECNVIQYNDSSRIRDNFLFKVLERTQSLARFTADNLCNWKEYLRWKEDLARRQIYGCKYCKITVDEKRNNLVFWLVCESREYFQSIRKFLFRRSSRGDLQAFENGYSSDEWVFKLADASKDRRFKRSVELGQYRGIVKEFYLHPELATELEQGQSEQRELDSNTGDAELLTEELIGAPFKNPYIIQVAFELNRDDADRKDELEGNDITRYIYEEVIDKYETKGFVALSAVGELVLLRRFKNAIWLLEHDESCYSPNLAVWLFNVNQARCPEPADFANLRIDKWLNPQIEGNENQRETVIKMLAAPDLCLVQGPPGTGKTTVIAEAIYQFVRHGNRVLLASQSNDAVDNALERLIDTPEIRAIRLGQKSRARRRREDVAFNKFSEDEALKYYYGALSSSVSREWLDRWAELEEQSAACDSDIRDANFYNQDIAELTTRLSEITEKLSAADSAMAGYRKALDNANESNQTIINEKRQFVLFQDFIADRDSERFYLSEGQLRVIQNDINSIIRIGISHGVYLAQGELDIDTIGERQFNTNIELAKSCIETLKKLIEKASKASQQQGGDELELKRLRLELEKLREAWGNAEDEEVARKLWKECKSLQLKIDTMAASSSNVGIMLTASERSFISTELLTALDSSDRQRVIESLNEIIEKWSSTLDSAVQHLTVFMKMRTIVDVKSIYEDISRTEGQLKVLRENDVNIRGQIESKRNTLTTLTEKYNVGSTDMDSIVQEIQRVQNECRAKLENQQKFRSQWEGILKRFKARLNDPDSIRYDQHYYQQIYINACNVVGISCTDNMRDMDETFKGFDVVIIDEVSKATPPELLIPLMKARKAILVGDHRQLPPMFKEQERSYQELMERLESDSQDSTDSTEDGETNDGVAREIADLMTMDNFRRFQSMVTASLFKNYFENASTSIKHTLNTQYRMHSDISRVINRFYDGTLRDGLNLDGSNSESENEKKNHGLMIMGIDGLPMIIPRNHAYWLDSSVLPDGKPVYESFPRNSTSACNYLEVYIIIELLKKMADAHREAYKQSGGQARKTVGVISFYQMQVNELRAALRETRRAGFDFSPMEIDVNTVDRFQGKEKNIIITSLVRNNKSAKASKHIIAFERINVAFSRAQELLVIVGAKHMYETLQVTLPNMDRTGYTTVPVYKNIMDDLNRRACFRGTDRLITQDIQDIILKRCQESQESRQEARSDARQGGRQDNFRNRDGNQQGRRRWQS